jgi:signal peptidase II
MILGGAVGNFIDRMRMQMVVDFIDCDFPDFIMTRFPTFNVADSFVTVGVAIVILSPVILKKIHHLLPHSNTNIHLSHPKINQTLNNK